MRLALAALVAAVLADPFAFLAPTLSVPEKEQRRLASGEVLVRTVRGRSRDVTLVAAVKIQADASRLIAWYRQIEHLRKNERVPQVGRFSSPPRLEDLATLTLDQVDVDELRSCRPDNCGLKLTPDEVRSVKLAFTGPREHQQAAAQTAFRQVVLARAERYLKTGRADGPPPPAFFTTQWPTLSDHILHYPRVPRQDVESFLYWSKEKLSGKPIISATHVTIDTTAATGHLPAPLVVSRQIFATHYVDGAWGITSITRAGPDASYLVYVNQSEVDLLRGLFGGFVRSTIERQLRGEADDLVRGVRDRLEGGLPPLDARRD